MAAFSPGPIQKGRRQPLLRSVRACRSAAADIKFYAQKIWCAHLWPRLADRARIEILDLSSAGAFERDQRRAIPRARRAGVRISGWKIEGNDRGAGNGDAQGCRENGF